MMSDVVVVVDGMGGLEDVLWRLNLDLTSCFEDQGRKHIDSMILLGLWNEFHSAFK